jgi:hypothetical protein
MGNPLKNLIITSTGDLPHKPSQLQKWVEANGGRWVPKPTKGLTHLLCSKEHFRKSVEAVTKAQKLGAHIVTYDWLEDSLQRKRKLAERKYAWAGLEKERRKRKERKRVAAICDSKSSAMLLFG